jgi:AmmeMemoRadiSam system protein A
VKSTTTACTEVGRAVVDAAPAAVVITAPHGARHPTDLTLHTVERLAGDLGRFGAPEVRIELPGAVELAEAIVAAGIPGVAVRPLASGGLEYSTVVPLSFLYAAGWRGPTLVVGLPYPGEGDPAAIGTAVARAADRLGLNIGVIASGDMSHRLTRDAPAGFDPQGARFDAKVTALLQSHDFEALRHLDPDLLARAGEDCLDSLLFAAGCLGFGEAGEAGEAGRSSRLLSYEGPFGVGYGVAILAASEDEPDSSLPELARDAIRAYVANGQIYTPSTPLPAAWQERAPVFVTLHTPGGELRGCIGSLEPTTANIARETIDRAIAAATTDPRFAPVRADEVADLDVEVSRLSPLEEVGSPADLDPIRYGVVVETGGRRGVLLPAIPGIDDAEQQVAIARRKAGLGPETPVRLYRFTVEKASSPGRRP